MRRDETTQHPHHAEPDAYRHGGALAEGPDLSIVIVNWNTRELLRQCLESVYRTINGLTFEVVMVDNASTDGSQDMVARDFPQVTLLRNQENLGFARANNQAIRASAGRHVMLLNSDAYLLGDGAARMVRFLDDHPEAGAVGGKVFNPDGTFQSSFADFPNLLTETLLLTGLSRVLLPPTFPSYPEASSQSCRQVDWLFGSFFTVRRRMLDEGVGLLDEDYFMYTEETDWCFRMHRHGWALYYLPDAQAVHHGGGTSRRVPQPKRAQLYRSKWLFMSKHYGLMPATVFRWLVRGVSGLKLLVWFGTQLSPNPDQRALARQNVASYQFLLSRF